MPRRQSSAQLTEDQKDKLISLVHKNKAIWCKKEKAFMRTDILSKLWNAISDEMGIEKEILQAAWKSLTTRMRAEVAAAPRVFSGSEAVNYQSNWVHFSRMRFFTSEVMCGETSGNLDALDKSNATPVEESKKDLNSVLVIEPVILPCNTDYKPDHQDHDIKATKHEENNEIIDYLRTLVSFILEIKSNQAQLLFREELYSLIIKFIGTSDGDDDDVVYVGSCKFQSLF